MSQDAKSSKQRKSSDDWKDALSDLRKQQKLAHNPAPDDPGYLRQKQNGKLHVRERLAALLDPDTFMEIGSITGSPVYDESSGELKSFLPTNLITGWGKVQGRKVFVTADDFSVRGGHADGGIAGKAPYGEVQARKAKVPLIRLLDGSSGGGSVTTYLSTGATYIPGLAGLGQSMDAMSVVPVSSALLGPVVGLGAAKAVIGHFSVMVKGVSQLFAAEPPVVKQATFEDLTKEQLGGWEIHARNGTVDNVAISELDAFQQIRTFLSFLPPSIFVLPPVHNTNDLATRREEELISIIPRRRGRSYDIRRLIRLIVDNPTDDTPGFFEIGSTWGQNIVSGFARLSGRSIGVLASDCTVNGGAIDALGSQKTARFVNLCDQFNIPILNLVDQPGFAIGSLAERMATIRHGASAIAALYHASIPIYTVIIRRAFGVAGSGFTDPEDGKNTRIAWPSADWGSLPLEGGIEAAYKRQLDSAESPEAREKLIQDLLIRFEDVRSPLRTANKFGVEEIIDPRDTRPIVCDWAIHVYEHVLPPLVSSRTVAFGTQAGRRVYRL
ncbi:propionyl-CoA carboxylase [Dendrothele bispora CBS 962.96]|uniref:Propionyl-CoA carboxylase n=1 Tax=Dendrothele bispora (strain CBS 962.96) TaxID=1314807 RepID=A0A4S8MV57_DENBC|nr:propionyl-CoA carboxylase [Dendrothele bispora CBS 962.96]